MSRKKWWKNRILNVSDNLVAEFILQRVMPALPIVISSVWAILGREIVLKYILLLVLSLVALVLAITLCKRKLAEVQSSCENYGIRIMSPRTGDHVGATLTIRGTFTTMPPEDRIKLFKIDVDNQYWPLRATISLDRRQNEWQAQVSTNTRPSSHITIMVTVIGRAGRVLCEYFERVGQSGYRYGIRTLTPDVQECDRVMIVRR